LDLFAPASSTTSTLSTSDVASGPVSGTSIASPHVAGAAALYLETHPTASPAAVSQALLSYATNGVLGKIGANSPNVLLYTQWGGGSDDPPPPPPPPPPSTDEPPYASFNSKCPRGQCRFDASGSSDDRGIMTYRWDFGDGSSAADASSSRAEHSYSAPGHYRVTLVVTDDAGQTGQTQRTLNIKKVR
jgi:PKD repeat protein